MSRRHGPTIPASITAKLDRANTHLAEVREVAAAVRLAGPDLIAGEFEPDSRSIVFRAQRDSLGPFALSAAVGDCVHNLRATLDYIAWELVRAAGKDPSTRTEFPIFTKPERYDLDAPRKIRGMAPEAAAVIRRLQPFAGPNSQPAHPAWRDPDEEPLALLYALDIWDKHRTLALTQDLLSGSLVGLAELGIYASPTPSKLPGRFEKGQVIARARMGEGRENANIGLRVEYEVVFDDDGPAAGESVVKTLASIKREVRDRVLPSVARFFAGG